MTLSRPRTSPKSPRIALLRGHPKNLQRTPRIERNSSTKKHSTIQCIYIDIEPLFQSAVVYDKHWLPFAITGLGHHSDSLEISQRNCLAQQSHHQLFRSHRSRCVSITTMKKKTFWSFDTLSHRLHQHSKPNLDIKKMFQKLFRNHSKMHPKISKTKVQRSRSIPFLCHK